MCYHKFYILHFTNFYKKEIDKLEKKNIKGSFIGLIPFLVFIFSYLLIGYSLIKSGDPMGFYGFKSPIAVILGIIVAFIIIRGSIDEKFNIFVKGCSDENITIMCIIYLLAGAFSVVSKQMGAVDSVVNLGLYIIPSNLIIAGIFLIGCFLSLSTGTSVGTIVAIGPIALGFAEKLSISPALVLGALISGAMFGDNLSVISDTTIAATRTQSVDMNEKFKTNLSIALPAMIITIILFLIFGSTPIATNKGDYPFDIIKIIPYLFVLISAISGMNVFIVLTLGTILSGVIGIYSNSFNLLEFSNHIYDGFNGMFEIFLLSMLTGGLAALVTHAGGLEFLLNKIKSLIKGKKSAEVGIALITLITDFATANNTVAIIIDGPIVKNISKQFKIDPRRAASLLDIFASVGQGFVPYGAQILIATQLTKGAVSPMDVLPYLWYQYILAIVAISSIFIPFANTYINNNPWDFDKWKKAENKA